MLNLEGIEAIIFDLGGVIIELDFQRSFDRFASLSGKSAQEIRKGLLESDLLIKYEQGQSDDSQFMAQVKSVFQLSCCNEELESAFLALLLHIPKERIALIRSLAAKYRLFVLSNTSPIHYKEVNNILLRDTGHEHLDGLFEKVFLSYELGLLKPGKEIYNAVLDAAGLDPARTLFLDDNEANLLGASSVGIRTVLVSPQQSILSLFQHE